jgi:hypothetical protein
LGLIPLFVGGGFIFLSLCGFVPPFFGPTGASTLEVSSGLAGYQTDGGELRASIWMTNKGSAYAMIGLGYRCVVESSLGSTNYTAGVTNGWLWLRPRQGVVLTSGRYLVPLPEDTRRWSYAIQARRATSRERIISFLVRTGLFDYRALNWQPVRYVWGSNPGPERAAEEWEEFESGWIEARVEGR